MSAKAKLYFDKLRKEVKSNYLSSSALNSEQKSEVSELIFSSLLDGNELSYSGDNEKIDIATTQVRDAVGKYSKFSNTYTDLARRSVGKPLTALRTTNAIINALSQLDIDFGVLKSEKEEQDSSTNSNMVEEEMFQYMFGNGSSGGAGNKKDKEEEHDDETKDLAMIMKSFDKLEDEKKEIQKDEETQEDILGSFSGSLEDLESYRELLRLKQSNIIKQFLEVLGSFKKAIRAKLKDARKKGNNGIPVDIIPDNDIRRLVPNELLGLSIPGSYGTRNLYRFLNRETLCVEMSERVPGEKGHFSVLVDKSGSMQSHTSMKELEDLQVALAIACAAIMIAHEEKRETELILFDEETRRVSYDLSTPAGEVDFIKKISNFWSYGGTRIGTALRSVEEKSSVLLITDGYSNDISTEDIEHCGKINVVAMVDEIYPGIQELKDKSEQFVQIKSLLNDQAISAVTSALL